MTNSALIDHRRTPAVAVIGSGHWGKNLVRNFHQLGALKLICDKNETLLVQFKEQYPDVETCLALSDVLIQEEIQSVAIATPAESHFTLTREALQAGKHVFVEKPLSLTEEEGRELVQLAEQNKLTLMVGHILHYHPAVIKLREIINSGELGKIQYLYSNRLNIGKIRAEENILWSFAPHDISVILMLLGEMPETVYATGGSYLQHQIPDTTLTTLDFASGVKAHIFVSWLHPFKEQKLVVVGDKKMAVFDDVSQEKLLLYPHKIEWLRRIPVAAKAEAEVVRLRQMEEPLKAECKHFLDCVKNNQTPRTDGHEGLRVLKILNASQRSLDENDRRIQLGHEKGDMYSMPEKQHLSLAESVPEGDDSFSSAKSAAEKVCVSLRGSAAKKEKDFFVHESAYIDDDVEIGAGTKIWHFSHILSNCKIGERCNIGQNVVIGPDVNIGNKVKIQNNVSVFNGVTIEDGVFCGPSMVFTNVYNPRSYVPRKDQFRKTLVKEGVTLGANCTIMCGLTLGRFSFVGAGAVVLDDVPDFALVVGNPAKIKEWMCSCGIQLHFYKDKATCNECGSQYMKKEDKIVEAQ